MGPSLEGFVGDCGGVKEGGAGVGDHDSKEEKAELLLEEENDDDANEDEDVLFDAPLDGGVGRFTRVACFSGDDGCVGTCFDEPVSSMR